MPPTIDNLISKFKKSNPEGYIRSTEEFVLDEEFLTKCDLDEFGLPPFKLDPKLSILDKLRRYAQAIYVICK